MDFKNIMKKNGSDHNPCGAPLFTAPKKGLDLNYIQGSRKNLGIINSNIEQQLNVLM